MFEHCWLYNYISQSKFKHGIVQAKKEGKKKKKRRNQQIFLTSLFVRWKADHADSGGDVELICLGFTQNVCQGALENILSKLLEFSFKEQIAVADLRCRSGWRLLTNENKNDTDLSANYEV